ncbi:MAG: glycosyltransferase family 2 protein [Magnetococcales bacterium]|nr:glycosyltransferase family 2 protein [Magnetococcales bacterium]
MDANSKKLPLSVTIITLNESDALPACLESVAFAEDLVVVDSGSTDDTLQIAQSMGARVFSQPWLGYGQQKNFAVDQARHDWVLCLDADERVDPLLRASIETALSHPNPPFNGYQIARRNHFLGRGLKHGFGYPDINIRLMNRHRGRWTEPSVHEYIQVTGPVGRLDGDLLHFSAENFQQYLEKHNRYTTLQAQMLMAHPPRWLRLKMVVNPLVCFIKGYVIKRAFLDGLPGLVHTVCHCFTTFTKYAKLYESLLREKRAG